MKAILNAYQLFYTFINRQKPMKQICFHLTGLVILFFLGICSVSIANVPGGGTGGANVTVTDNGTTVVLSNGIIAATITKSTAAIETLSFNGYDMLSGGYNGGQVYWSWNMPNYQNPSGCTYTLTANPSNNNGDYAEIKLHMVWNGSAATAAMDVDVYYSLPRGAQGIYASAMLTHPSNYPANPGGEWRMASYPGSTFDWLSVDSLRNRKMASLSDWNAASAVTGAPKEVELLTTGIYKNQYECKYDYSADFGDIDVWGWSSTAKNIGIWVTAPSKEYYNGGPMKRELMCHNSPTMLNMLGGQHYGMGGDLDIAAGETWQKTFGPFLIYCNSVTSGTLNAWKALWDDAKVQAKTEQAAWPYTWYTNSNYVQESGRGTVTGKIVINDITNPAASDSGLWVGVAVTPISTTGITDFQMWAKNYQFWVKTNADGSFTIPHVLPGTYNIYAFGPGAAGQMTKTSYLTVTAGNTTALGNVVWVPDRTAPTVWEIGTPDRSAKEFKHGSDWWTSNILPSTHWAKFMDYPDEFPNDVNFTIGQSNITTDWNFVQNYDNTVQAATPNWQVNFNLASAPLSGSTAAIYTAFASSYNSAIIVKVNGTLITTSTGVYPPNASDAKVRKAIHGAFGDLRFTFAASLLHAGANTVSFTIRNTGGATVGEIMYDYVRLEASIPTLTPSVSITASATTICNGTSVTFTATPVNGGTAPAYQWKINGTNAGTNSNIFTSTALTNNNAVTCVLTSNATGVITNTATSNSITITVNALPAKPTVSWDGVQLSVPSSYSTYQWLLNNATVSNASANTFKPVSSGYYQVAVTNTAGCKVVSDSFAVTVTAIADPAASDIASVYPNPSNGNITIDLGFNPALSVKLVIISATGNQVKTLQTKNRKTQIATTALASGIYYIKVMDAKNNRVLSFTVN